MLPLFIFPGMNKKVSLNFKNLFYIENKTEGESEKTEL